MRRIAVIVTLVLLNLLSADQAWAAPLPDPGAGGAGGPAQRLAALEQQVVAPQQQVASLQGDLATATGTIADLQTRLTPVEADGALALGPRDSSVHGGDRDVASSGYASVSGGRINEAAGLRSSVAGGDGNQALGARASIAGGCYNTADAEYSTAGGGYDVTAGVAERFIAQGRLIE